MIAALLQLFGPWPRHADTAGPTAAPPGPADDDWAADLLGKGRLGPIDPFTFFSLL